jgi:protein phosphatase inhibitor 2
MEKRIADVGPALGRFIEENKTDSVIAASDRTIAVLEKLYNVEEKDGEEALKAMKSHFAYIINGHFKRAGYTSTEVVSRLLRNRDRRARAAVFRTFVCEYEPEASFLLATPEQSDEDWRLASAPDTKCRLKGSDDASRKLKLVVEQPAWIGRGFVEEAAARHSDGTDCAERLLYYIITEAVSESDDDIDAGGGDDDDVAASLQKSTIHDDDDNAGKPDAVTPEQGPVKNGNWMNIEEREQDRNEFLQRRGRSKISAAIFRTPIKDDDDEEADAEAAHKLPEAVKPEQDRLKQENLRRRDAGALLRIPVIEDEDEEAEDEAHGGPRAEQRELEAQDLEKKPAGATENQRKHYKKLGSLLRQAVADDDVEDDGESEAKDACEPRERGEPRELPEVVKTENQRLREMGPKRSGESRSILKWDEETIAEHDKERGTRMKIDEPNTPFHFDPVGDDCAERPIPPRPTTMAGDEGGGRIAGEGPRPSPLADFGSLLNSKLTAWVDDGEQQNDHASFEFKRPNHYKGMGALLKQPMDGDESNEEASTMVRTTDDDEDDCESDEETSDSQL